ncbi:ABC transporter substrate-binding protein [Nocardia sp. NBC_00565]|uniref:ABC transporter substrate-binding protein n=1 Tax=Nocardia sp. NBC_00565 TaxID=2975993 RepID=UPI002E8248FC|nr:ABC transporter substrate-binding protein [Nocardia sp. NBC_00565]WUC02837.1 ABC transporter substrate-binding protein [Nocardia sp. NBC_00565]
MNSIRTAMIAVVAGLLAAACTLPTRHAPAPSEPVTVTHAFGSTTISATPKKVVTLGNQWLDTALALGVTPVGYIDDVASVSKRAAPWEPASLESARALNTSGNITEQVAALAPDLILVDSFLADRQSYDQLSAVAPTLPARTEAAVWQDQVIALGRVLRKEDAATHVIADVDAKVASIAQANPRLTGKTFVCAWLAGPAQLIVLTDPDDGLGKVFTRLGLSIPQSLHADQDTLALPPERIDELAADLLLAGYSPGMDEKYRQFPGYADLPAVRKGAVVFLTLQEFSAITQPTALSEPYLLKKLEPAFANAAK